MSAAPIPHPAIVAHRKYLGPWCSGVDRDNHWSDRLVVTSSGAVFCPDCAGDHEAILAAERRTA